jgi:hypothetical protein
MQSKGLLSLIIIVAIGIVSVSTSVADVNDYYVDLDGTDAMEELAFIMAAAAEQELTVNAMGP